MANIVITNQTEPTTPASGDTVIYVDSSAKTIYSKNDDGDVTVYGGGGVTTFLTVLLAEASSGSDNDLMYCVETETLYRYVSLGSAYTNDDKYVLSTGDLGDTRYLGVAGKYIAEGQEPLASKLIIVDDTDNTKQVVFDVSNITTATKRTLTVQDSDDTLIGRATIDTLTNKTLNSPVVNISMTGNFINGVTDKAIPIVSDEILIGDTEADNAIKKADLASAVLATLLDEDNMASDSATQGATQQSIKKYVDDQVATVNSWDEVMHLGNTFTVDDTENISVSITQNDTTNNPPAIIITNTGSGNDITAPNFTLVNGILTGTTLNGTTAIQLNGVNINTGGTLDNVAYLDQSNTFTANQTIDLGGLVHSVLNINGSVDSSIRSTATDLFEITHNGITPISISVANTTIGNDLNLASGKIITLNGLRLLHTTGTSGCFVGESAGNLTLTGSANTALGTQALSALTDGANNVAIGYRALSSTSSGDNNIGIGRESLRANTSGSNNVSIGYYCLKDGTTSQYNVAIGYQVLQASNGLNNIGIGQSTLNSLTSGDKNVAIGWNALRNITTTDDNVGIGSNAGLQISSGASNTGASDSVYIGSSTKANNISETNQVVIGHEAIGNGSNTVTIGNDSITKTYLKGCVGIGREADVDIQLGVAGLIDIDSGYSYHIEGNPVLSATTLGEFVVNSSLTSLGILTELNISGKMDIQATGDSIFIGREAGNVDDGSSNKNVGIGGYSLKSNTSGYDNTAVGHETLNKNTTGSYNAAFGFRALYYHTVGEKNTAIGALALNSTTNGDYNTGCGTEALYTNSTGISNTAIGSNALHYNTTGSGNTASGYYAGRYIANGTTWNSTGTNNIFLGSSTKALADGDTNEIVIGYNAIGIGSNTVVLGNDSITKTALKGIVGIGTTVPDSYLEISNTMGTTRGSTSFLITGNRSLDITSDGTFNSFNTNASGTSTGGLHFKLGGSTALSILDGGTLSTGAEESPDVDDGGLCLNHGDNDGYSMTFKNSDVEHSFTSYNETDTYGCVKKASTTEGGLLLRGLSDNSSTGIYIDGWAGAVDSTHTSTSIGAVHVRAYTDNGGTDVSALGVDDDIFTIANGGNTKLIVKGDGDIRNPSSFRIYAGNAWMQLNTDGSVEYSNGANITSAGVFTSV